MYLDNVKAYIDEELKNNATILSFAENPMSNCHTSLLMTHEKPNALNKQVIISWSREASEA